jgi:hypothetical protein
MDASAEKPPPLLFVLFFFFVVIIVVFEIAVFARRGFLVIVVVIVLVVRDDIQVDGMRLRNFEFGFALRATENLAFLDFVFIDIDFGGTFRATDHESILRKIGRGAASQEGDRHLAAYYIPRAMKSTLHKARPVRKTPHTQDRNG